MDYLEACCVVSKEWGRRRISLTPWNRKLPNWLRSRWYNMSLEAFYIPLRNWDKYRNTSKKNKEIYIYFIYLLLPFLLWHLLIKSTNTFTHFVIFLFKAFLSILPSALYSVLKCRIFLGPWFTNSFPPYIILAPILNPTLLASGDENRVSFRVWMMQIMRLWWYLASNLEM